MPAGAATIIGENKGTLAITSVLFLLGMAGSWSLLSAPGDLVFNWYVFHATLLACGVLTGAVLGYRCQGLHGDQRLLALAYPVSWRIGCIWIVVSAIVECVRTDFTVGYTLDILSPHIFIATGLMALAFAAGWLARIIVVGMRALSRLEWLQVVAILVATVGIIVFSLSHPEADLPAEKMDVATE